MAMELRVLLLLPLCLPGLHAQRTGAEESRSEGSTLYIQCPYTPQADYPQRKAWGRMTDREFDVLVETTQYPYKTKATNGKVTIEDDPTNRTVSITMTNLQAEDSGTYICAYLSYDDRYHPLKEISLNVFKELHKQELDSLSVQCPYSTLRYSTGAKAWCRRESPTTCTVVARTDYPSTRHSSKALKDRTLIQDDSQQRTVTITMQKLQAQDTGVYWCALYSSLALTRMMEVRLSVAKRTQQYTAKESDNVSVRCPYSVSDYGDATKAWCKEGLGKACTFSGFHRASAGITLPGTAGTSQSTPLDHTPAPSLQIILWLVIGIVTNKILAIVILVFLARRRKRNSTAKASR